MFGGSQTQEKDTFQVESSDGTSGARANQEDYLAKVYGDFLNSDDQRVTHYRKILGILTLQTGTLLVVAALSARIGLLAALSENALTTAVALFALIGSTTMLIMFAEKRTTLPDAHLLLAAFILGIAFSVTSVTEDMSSTFVLLVIWALFTAPTSIFIGALLGRNTTQAQWFMQLGGLAGGASMCLMVPFYLAQFYGEDYSFSWVVLATALETIVSYYIYYDLTTYQYQSSAEEDGDYVYAFLMVYVDWAFIIFYAFLRCCWRKMTESSE